MQINNNFNRFSAPQFGMALKVNKGAQEYLQKQSMDTLEKLAQAGKDMADFKFWDLEVNEKGFRIKSKRFANAYINPEINRDRDPNRFKSFTDVTFDTVYDGINGPKGQKYPVYFDLGTNEKAAKVYNEFPKLDYVDKNIELTKLLETRDVQKAAAEAAKKDAAQAKNNFISDLFEKFGNKQVEI